MTGGVLWLGVVLLSGTGALARFWVDAAVSTRLGGRLPYGTLVVNLSGAFALGIITGLGVAHGLSLLLGTALLGSYTTFSTWMLETLFLTEDGRDRAAVVNLLAQTAAGIALAALGWGLGASL